MSYLYPPILYLKPRKWNCHRGNSLVKDITFMAEISVDLVLCVIVGVCFSSYMIRHKRGNMRGDRVCKLWNCSPIKILPLGYPTKVK